MTEKVRVPWGSFNIETGKWLHNIAIIMSPGEQLEQNVMNGFCCVHAYMPSRCPFCAQEKGVVESDKVITFPGVTRLDIPVDRVLSKAQGRLEKGLVIGYDKEGGIYFSSSMADGGTVLWLLEKAKKMLLEVGEE